MKNSEFSIPFARKDGTLAVETPGFIEKEITEPNGPLEKICTIFAECGVDEKEIGRYKKAVEAFFKERPSEVVFYYYDTRKLGIHPYYFAPNIFTPHPLLASTGIDLLSIPALKKQYKPHIKKETGKTLINNQPITLGSINGSEVLQGVREHKEKMRRTLVQRIEESGIFPNIPIAEIIVSLYFEMIKNNEDFFDALSRALKKFRGEGMTKEEDHKLTILFSQDTHTIPPQDKWIMQLNRLAYALHEPIHILQSLVPGDVLNAIIHSIPKASTVADGHKINTYLSNSLVTHPLLADHIPESMLSSALFFVEEGEGREGVKQSVHAATYEMTIDLLADECMRDTLRKHPVVLFQLHNSIAAAMEGILSLRETWLNSNIPTEQKKESLQEYTILKDTLEHSARPYFAAFDSMREGLEYIKNHNADTVMNAKAHGTLAQPSIEVSSRTVFNILSEMNAHTQAILEDIPLKKDNLYCVAFDEDGITHYSSRSQNDPDNPVHTLIRPHAPEVTAIIMNDAIHQGYRGLNLLNYMAACESDPNFANSVVSRLSDKLNTNIPGHSNMYTYSYPSVQPDRYMARLLYRKALMPFLKEDHPAEYNKIIQTLFFRGQPKLLFDGVPPHAAVALFGFDPRKELPENMWADTQFSFANIDMRQLTPDQRIRLEKSMNSFIADSKNPREQRQYIQTLLTIAVAQKF